MIIKVNNLKGNKHNILHSRRCPVCASQKYKVLYEDNLFPNRPVIGYDFSPKARKSYRIVQCLKCSHAYCSPIPNDIYKDYIEVEDRVYLKNTSSRIKCSKKVIKTLLRYKKNGKLLDIGCSTGDFIKVASKYYNCEGLEISNWAVKIARRNNIVINQQLLADLNIKKTYDIITLWGVIEHFDNLEHEVKLFKKHLNKQGVVALWTGNVGSITVKFLGRKWWHFIGQHLQFFTQKSIDKLFLKNGFTKIYSGRYPYVKSLQSVSNTLSVYPVVGKLFKLLFDNSFGAKILINITMPSEMFIIYRLKG